MTHASYEVPTQPGTAPATKPETALLFPGQGSHSQAMHALALEHCPELLRQAGAALGADPFERLTEGTTYLQPAIYCGTLAYWRAAGEPTADFAAGHSLGELAALTAAGCFSPEEGMELVLARATAMQCAAEGAGAGGMIAVIGPRDVALALEKRHGLTVAADNQPAELVLSGPVELLEAARLDARSRGVKAVRLRVPAALHSAAMQGAAAPFRRALAGARLAEPRMIVIANVTAAPFCDVRSELVSALTSCVRWRETAIALRAAGVRSFDEMGTHGTLAALVRSTVDVG